MYKSMINMKQSFKLLGISVALLVFSLEGKAQVDPHFSNYYVYPSWLNPGLTGIFDGGYRVSAIYRTQWGSISSPYSTMGLSADFSTNTNANFGVSLLNQTAGDGGYTYTTAYGNGAFTGLRFGAMESKRVVFGLQFGLIQRRFNPDKLTFGNQWNPVTGFNPNQNSNEVINKNSSAFDMGAGAFFFDAMPGQLINAFGGFSVSHLTRPKDDFFASDEEAVIPMRYTVHGGMRIRVNDEFSITPNALFLSQGTATEAMIGAYGQKKVGPVTDFMLGVNYRFNDAVAPFVGFTHKSFMLGTSYDINTSDLGKLANGANSFEISLSYIGRKAVKTPEVEFVCPRL